MIDRRLELFLKAYEMERIIPAIFPANTHICHFYKTKEDLFEVLVPFFAEGLAREEFCLWGVTFPLTIDEARATLGKVVTDIAMYEKNNQLEIFDIGFLYGMDDFDAEAVRDVFLLKVEANLAKGWRGFRCDGITSGIKSKDWKNFQIYEEEVTRTLSGPVTVLCSYNLEELSPRQLDDVTGAHPTALIKKEKEWCLVDLSAAPARLRS